MVKVVTPNPIILDPWQEVIGIHFPDDAASALTYLTCHTRIVEDNLPPDSAAFGTFSGIGIPQVAGYEYFNGYYTQFDLAYQSHNGIHSQPYPTVKWVIDSLRDQYNEPIFGADGGLFVPNVIIEPAPITQSGSQITAGYSPRWRPLDGALVNINGLDTAYQAGQCIIEIYGEALAGGADEYNDAYPAPVTDKPLSAPVVRGVNAFFGQLDVTPTEFLYDGAAFAPIGFQLQYPSYNGLIGASKHFYISAICRKQ